jgi:ribokinase
MDLVARCARLPGPGETVMGHQFETHHGGKGANQAVAAARGGAKVCMLGCVGADAHGQALRAGLVAEGIDVTALRSDAAHPTGVALIAVAEDAQNSIVVVPGANSALTPLDWAQARGRLRPGDWLVAQLEVPLPLVSQALEEAHALGVFTVLNAAPVAVLTERTLASLTCLIVNEHEAQSLCGLAANDVPAAQAAAEALRAMGPRQVIITLGAQGVMHADAKGVSHHPATPVKALDTTGAGDTFVGVFCACMAAGRPLAEALSLAQKAASIAVTRRGAQSSMPSLQEILS